MNGATLKLEAPVFSLRHRSSPTTQGGTPVGEVSGTIENRKMRRVPSRLRCWCEGENVTVYARIGNLSEGGMFLRTSTPLALGSRAVLRFGSDDAVETQAVVVWARLDGDSGPPGMGLKFDPFDNGGLERIRRIIESEQQSEKARGN